MRDFPQKVKVEDVKMKLSCETTEVFSKKNDNHIFFNTGFIRGHFSRIPQIGLMSETSGDKNSGRRTHHPTQAHMWGDNERQGEAWGDKISGRRTHHPTEAHMWGDETRGDKTSGRRTHHPTQAHMWGHKGRKGETIPWEGGHTIQHQGGDLMKTLRNPTVTARRLGKNLLHGSIYF